MQNKDGRIAPGTILAKMNATLAMRHKERRFTEFIGFDS